jgi:hypothetical protein
LAHRIEFRQSDTERGIGSVQPLNIEPEASGNETSNIGEEVTGKWRVINRRGKISEGDGRVE